ncbi:hypothetical protein AB0D14_08390 [Streptomyces sp. NPDC048484]|uniref:hypothetical protein n=1 Tax=Streptomyces sp. NPDC048484 TaxID=3155146 RepID=UPI00341646C6
MSTDENYEFPYERRCADMLRDLGECPDLTVSKARFGTISKILGDVDRVFKGLARDSELSLVPEIREHFFRFNRIEAHWRSSSPDTELVGEIDLKHVYGSMAGRSLHHTWEGSDDEERALHRELRVFDDTPRSGTGRMAALRIVPGATNPEVWYLDMRQGAIPMELGYAAYLDILLITKGTIGWQYLYCDTGFGDPGFTSVAGGLKEMLEVFPRSFPDHDYAELRTRLQERL